MSSNASTNSIISQTPPTLEGKARVDLVKSDFDAIVWQKGYDVYLDKALRCPCRSGNDHQALSSCKNCGGSGWVYLNRYQTKMVLQSMNLDTKFKEWSEERIGTVRITAMNRDEIAFMDRITVIEGRTIVNDVVFPVDYYGELRARVNYEILEIDEIFLFAGSGTPLKRLFEGTDFDILTDNQGKPTNLLRFDSSYSGIDQMTISIRYQYAPQFHVLDVTRQIMSTQALDKSSGADIVADMPVSAMGRRSHYVLDEQNYNNDFLLNNSYAQDLNDCLIGSGNKPDTPQNFRIEHPNNTTVNLLWSDTPTEDTFIVQRKSPTGNWTQIAALPADTLSYIDSSLLPNTTYYYRVAARASSFQSEWSDEIGITTNP